MPGSGPKLDRRLLKQTLLAVPAIAFAIIVAADPGAAMAPADGAPPNLQEMRNEGGGERRPGDQQRKRVSEGPRATIAALLPRPAPAKSATEPAGANEKPAPSLREAGAAIGDSPQPGPIELRDAPIATEPDGTG